MSSSISQTMEQTAAHASALSKKESAQMRDIVLSALEDAKGEQVSVLDVQKMTDITDYMIVATGTSDRHVQTLADRVMEFMRDAGWSHIGVEGEEVKDWILVDFVDVIVHVMRAATREQYDLEGLWDQTFGELITE